MRPRIGMTLCRNLWAAPVSMASMAAMPLCEIARLMDLCWAAIFEVGRRGSTRLVNEFKDGGDEWDTWASVV